MEGVLQNDEVTYYFVLNIYFKDIFIQFKR